MPDLETPRLGRRLGIVMLVATVLAGAGGGAYALARAFGVGSSRHVTSTTHLATSGTSTTIPRCSDLTASVSRASQEGAAGTISTVSPVTNSPLRERLGAGRGNPRSSRRAGPADTRSHRHGSSDGWRSAAGCIGPSPSRAAS